MLRITLLTNRHENFFFFSMAQQPPVDQGLLVVEASRSHPDAPHSVWLLWTRDQLVAETSTWQNTTLTTDFHTPGRIRIHNPSMRPQIHDLGRSATEIMLGPVVTVCTRWFNAQSLFFLRTRFQRVCVLLNQSVASTEHRSVQCTRGTVFCQYELDTYRYLYVSGTSERSRYKVNW